MQLTPEAEARIFGAPADPTPEVTPAPPAPADGGQKLAPPAPQDPKAASLYDAIKAEREAKEARAKTESERESLRKRAEEAEAKVADILKAKDQMFMDAPGYLKSLGYTDQDIALHGESIMYHLMPDKAPEGLRGRLVEAQVRRDKARQAEEAKNQARQAEEQAAQQRAEAQAKMEALYADQLAEVVKAAKPGTFPDSEAWFGDDHESYTKSLFNTARNLAEAADRAGAQADLSPATVAKALELALAERFKRVRGVSAQQAPAKPATPVADPVKLPEFQTEIPDKTKRLTDAERLARATAAAFKRPE
jgi:type II secretory pathway pseudopilin PulG